MEVIVNNIEETNDRDRDENDRDLNISIILTRTLTHTMRNACAVQHYVFAPVQDNYSLVYVTYADIDYLRGVWRYIR